MRKLLNTERITYLAVFAASLLIYSIHFGDVFLHLNSVLSSITGDALKNYFTYAYHITNDESLLSFTGMHYPYGEHVVFTDCQPLLTFILRYLPFTHPYLVGILHFLMFFSFIISPLILLRVFRIAGLDNFVAAVCAIALNMLAPQFAKIHGGHHGLAYGLFIPLLLLQLLRYREKRQLVWLAVTNFLWFLMHPYIGFGACVFSFLVISLHIFPWGGVKPALRTFSHALAGGIVPLALFRIFMMLTDDHGGRTTEPYGSEELVENTATLLAPDFGPFMRILNSIFTEKVLHFEGHSYLGFFMIVLTLVFVVMLIPWRSKWQWQRSTLIILIASFILLLVSFGLHARMLHALGLEIASLNQFRAVCRFAWFFYYGLAVFMIPLFYRTLIAEKRNVVFLSAAIYLVCSLWEGRSYIIRDKHAFWNHRNILNYSYLNAAEKYNVELIKSKTPQAIMTLPVFYLGSEMYNRTGGDNSMIPAMLYSYHTKTPVYGCWMSRTSIPETAAALDLMNSYKIGKPVTKKLNRKKFLVICTQDALLPDEERLLSSVEIFSKNDSLSIGTVTPEELLRPKISNKTLECMKKEKADSSGYIYIDKAERPPFTTASLSDYQRIFTLDSMRFPTGRYILSLRYYYNEMKYSAVGCNLIVTERKGTAFGWKHNISISTFSGIYDGFGVFEHFLDLDASCEYEFLLKGISDKEYHISDFMIRPENLGVRCARGSDAPDYNNFPR